jgi:DNA-binding IclR family transcriptional regulator
MTSKPHAGTQSIERAMKLLQIVTTRRQSGWRLTDLASHSGLDDSTVLRIMSRLSAMRLVRRRQNDRRYAPGPALYELAVTLPAYYEFQTACHASLVRISAQTGWGSRLYLRSQDQTVLIDRVGPATLQVFNDLGTRRCLMASPQGIAILLALPRPEQRAIMDENRSQLRSGITRPFKSYEKMLKRSRDCGFGLSMGELIPGRSSIGIAILTPQGCPVAALGASGAQSEFTERNIQMAARLMQKEAAHIKSTNAEVFREMELS